MLVYQRIYHHKRDWDTTLTMTNPWIPPAVFQQFANLNMAIGNSWIFPDMLDLSHRLSKPLPDGKIEHAECPNSSPTPSAYVSNVWGMFAIWMPFLEVYNQFQAHPRYCCFYPHISINILSYFIHILMLNPYSEPNFKFISCKPKVYGQIVLIQIQWNGAQFLGYRTTCPLVIQAMAMV